MSSANTLSDAELAQLGESLLNGSYPKANLGRTFLTVRGKERVIKGLAHGVKTATQGLLTVRELSRDCVTTRSWNGQDGFSIVICLSDIPVDSVVTEPEREMHPVVVLRDGFQQAGFRPQ